MAAERTAQDSGFTLLEVVVALVITALAIVGLFQAASGGLLAVSTAGRVEEAIQRAQSHLAAVGRSAALIQGEFTDDDGGGYHWRLRVAQAPGRDFAAIAGRHHSRWRQRRKVRSSPGQYNVCWRSADRVWHNPPRRHHARARRRTTGATLDPASPRAIHRAAARA